VPALNIDLLDVFFCAAIWLLFAAQIEPEGVDGSEGDD